jgi:osmotically-inducible protein OsmY
MKLQALFVTTVLPVCSVLVITGCNENTYQGRPASSAERSVGQRVDDKTVAGRVRDALEEDAAYKFPDVQVTVFNGIIQLSGFVATREQKARAEAIAKSHAFDGKVENKISVKE